MSKKRMLVNYVPGEECRLALTSEGRLEELHEERVNSVSHVGNIYVGKVVNVESSIQAAFIDFGHEHNGFLHISDLHPKYFPGEDDDTTESVGKKTPRRDRPPIQQALKRGQEITVQVIKEGIGTKGPTLTSYLSIPGRYLVMMPDMEKVGVTRKVEDEDQRKKMRAILDQLDLPDEFGFILRTAGMDRTKTDLKRDLAYLQRLWKDMERRRKSGNKPRLLYAESDLLVRALRDLLTPEIEEVVIDDDSALKRAARFMKIVSPRSTVKLLRYEPGAPLFHAFGVEQQIERIFSREVPLPSGGSLVIDETEAMVAIDVNSGRMRGHGDSETTAYKTNQEAVDEICRQLKLRDLGGLVLMDLIDMRSRSHRKDIEKRLNNNLKTDRARTKALPISQFGIVELTRQRMKGSARSAHFAPCPECSGRGIIQRPDSVAAKAMRELELLLHHQRIHRVELVVSGRVASELLSNKRRRLGWLEHMTDKHVDVRVSESIGLDRVTFYAYDDRGADIDIEKLPAPAEPKKLEAVVFSAPKAEEDDWAVDPLSEQGGAEGVEAPADAEEFEDDSLTMMEESDEAEERGGKKKRRRRRGGRRRKKKTDGEDGAEGETRESEDSEDRAEADAETVSEEDGEAPKKKRRRRGRRGRRGRGGGGDAEQQSEQGGDREAVEPVASDDGARGDSWDVEPEAVTPAAEPKPKPKKMEIVDEPSREDSWDVEPEEVKPAPKKKTTRKKSTKKTAAKAETKAKEEAAEEPAGDRGDSWDVEPEAVKPAAKKKTASKKSAKKTAKKAAAKAETKLDVEHEASDDARGDSWDEEPAPAAKKKTASKKKASTRKKTTKKASSKATVTTKKKRVSKKTTTSASE